MISLKRLKRYLNRRSFLNLLSTLQSVLYTYSSSDFGECGENVFINKNVFISNCKKMRIGNNVGINPDCTLWSDGGIAIGDGSTIGPNTIMMTSSHNFKGNIRALPFDNEIIHKPITIGKYVYIGSNVILLPGVVVSDGSIIGAGSIVTKDVPPMAIVAGNPAKILSYRDKAVYDKLSEEHQSYIKNYRSSHPQRIPFDR